MHTIVTHVGSGMRSIEQVCRNLGANLLIVGSLADMPHHADWTHLLLLGGRDINPIWYGQGNTHSQPPDKTRDIIEWSLVRQAMTHGKPIFGICRGHQLLSVAHGGCLWQDINAQKVTSQAHDYDRHHVKMHKTLARHCPTNLVNSLHHQAVRTVPPGFATVAKSPDGIVEGVWKPGVLGVQWHPEMLYASNRRWLSLFRWFVDGLC